MDEIFYHYLQANLSQYVLQIGDQPSREFRIVARKRNNDVPHYFIWDGREDPRIVVSGVTSPDSLMKLSTTDVTASSLMKYVINPWTYCGPEDVRDITDLNEDILWVLLKDENIKNAGDRIKPLMLSVIKTLALHEISIRSVYPDSKARMMLSRALYSPVSTSLIFVKRIGDDTLRFVYDEERNGVLDYNNGPDSIIDFVKSAISGKIEPTWKSEDISSNDNSLVKIVTSKNFVDSVYSDIFHVILVSSTENCSFGLALRSTIDELSNIVSTDPNFTYFKLLRLNLSKNEIDPRIMKFDKCFSARLIRKSERSSLEIDIAPSISAGSILESIMNKINHHNEL